MTKYKLLCMAPDGEYVTAERDKTLEECIEASNDMGSRWIFYPFHFIVKDKGNRVEDNQRIIVAPDMLEHFTNKSFKNVRDILVKQGETFWSGIFS